MSHDLFYTAPFSQVIDELNVFIPNILENFDRNKDHHQDLFFQNFSQTTLSVDGLNLLQCIYEEIKVFFYTDKTSVDDMFELLC
jgi:hypothetical protein